jgi:enolase-phosphatase E1
MKVILLDIEGTTTPIDFVHKTLFPYARKQMQSFLTENFDASQSEIKQLKTEHSKDFAEGKYTEIFDKNSVRSICDYAKFLIDNDCKSTPLKSLQGKIWQKGYESGELKSEVFEDVPRAFERWKSKDKTIAIFSSGSVLAQKLIFANTNYGDLTSYISAYFDTNVGGKKEAESYLKIASTKSFPPVENFLFISDVVEELDAARQAGMQTLLVVREGNAPLNDASKHKTIRSFDEVEETCPNWNK